MKSIYIDFPILRLIPTFQLGGDTTIPWMDLQGLYGMNKSNEYYYNSKLRQNKWEEYLNNMQEYNKAPEALKHTEAQTNTMLPNFLTYQDNVRLQMAKNQELWDARDKKLAEDREERNKKSKELTSKAFSAGMSMIKGAKNFRAANKASKAMDAKTSEAAQEAADNAFVDTSQLDTDLNNWMQNFQNQFHLNYASDMSNILADPQLSAMTTPNLKKGGKLKKYRIPVHSTRGNLSVLDDVGVVSRKTLKLK